MPELKIESIKISKIVEKFRNGSWAIPEFQRGYEWRKKKTKAAKLIDSLYRGFPISAILLWETTEEVRARDKNSTQRRAVWVVDGQQRITTLCKVMEEESEIRVVFNPRGKDEKTGFDGQFQIESAATKKSQDWIYVNTILGDSDDFRTVLDGEVAKPHRVRIERLREILNYEVPVVTMVGHSFKEASDAFKRINVQGTKLSAAEIYQSEIAATHKNFIASQFTPFIQSIHHDKGFNGINQMHLFKVCEFNANGKNLYTIETAALKTAWAKTERATEKVVKFLDEQFGVKKMDILRSGALLVVPIALFSTLSGNDLDKEGLAGWLALAAIHHHYSNSTETTLTKDLAACGHQNPIRSLLKNIKDKKRSPKLFAVPENFGGQLNDKGALFAAYVACRHKGCLGLFTGEKLMSYYDVDQHHLFPRAQFAADASEGVISSRDSDNIANIAFIKMDANRKLGSEPPSVYLEGRKEDRLISQCIPLDKKLWTMDNAEAFWKVRKELLAEAFNEFVQQKLSHYRLH